MWARRAWVGEHQGAQRAQHGYGSSIHAVADQAHACTSASPHRCRHAKRSSHLDGGAPVAAAVGDAPPAPKASSPPSGSGSARDKGGWGGGRRGSGGWDRRGSFYMNAWRRSSSLTAPVERRHGPQSSNAFVGAGWGHERGSWGCWSASISSRGVLGHNRVAPWARGGVYERRAQLAGSISSQMCRGS